MQNRNEQLRFAYSSRLQPRTSAASGDAPAPTMPCIRDMNGEPIRRGDQVFAPIRGGRHEGMVEMIMTGEEEAAAEDIPHPPKVLYVDHQGNVVAHDPEAIRHVEKGSEGSDGSAGSSLGASLGGAEEEDEGQRRRMVI